MQLPFGARELEHIPAEKVVHLVEKGRLPVPAPLLRDRKGAFHWQCLTCTENITGLGTIALNASSTAAPSWNEVLSYTSIDFGPLWLCGMPIPASLCSDGYKSAANFQPTFLSFCFSPVCSSASVLF